MGDLKGIAEVVEHLIYETLALLIPGGLFALGVAAAVEPNAWTTLVHLAGENPILSAISAYSVGYVVQGLSRFATRWADNALALPCRAAVGLVRLHSAPAADRFKEWLGRRQWSILGRVGWPCPRVNSSAVFPNSEPDSAVRRGAESVDLNAVASQFLCERLMLPSGSQFRREDVRALAFSALLPERHRLDRFRAAASFARGTATVVAFGCAALMAVLVLPREFGGWPVTTAGVSTVAVLVIVYLALMERSTMYDSLWVAIIVPQFLISETRNASAPGLKTRDERQKGVIEVGP